MRDVRDLIWEVRESKTPVPKAPTDPCGATCHECRSAWRCLDADQDCQTPYALHRCPACTVQTYVPPYWLHRGKVVRDRRTQESSVIVNVSLGLTRQDSVVEILPASPSDLTGRPDYLRSLVIRVGLSDIEQHFEPTAQKMPADTLP